MEEMTEKATKITETTETSPTFHSGVEETDDHRTIILILGISTSLFVGVSFCFCCIWFVYLRRSKKKNKIRPSAFHDDAEVNISERTEDVELIKNNKHRSSWQREKANSITSVKTKKSFQVVSTVRFELNEVEI